MARTDLSMPTWTFPARNGGIDFVSDPSSAHFSDAPIPKLVREVIQNSLDAKHDGYTDPVVVDFLENHVRRNQIGTEVLEQHIAACSDRAAAEGRARAMAVFKRALDTSRQKTIRCLTALDSGTIGLDDARWNALVVQEGAVSKLGGAPGGNYGIGKNAALNVSDMQTVFYSTRFVAGRRGRVEKMQGKATLMGHTSPDGSGEQLQHIGFYAEPDGSPIMGRDIPSFFRLEETGTGVFIIGFNPRSTDWVGEVTAAVVENFFVAVSDKQLVVRVTAERSADAVTIDHQTLDSFFDGKGKLNAAAHYYRAVRDFQPESTSKFSLLGPLSVYAMFQDGAPRRTALVNRNGMLIADSKDLRVNPVSPRARGIWPDYAAVVIPATDRGDLWLRSMENPSHDSLSTAQLPSETERRDADRLFRRVRAAISGIIEDLAEVDAYGQESNIDELTGVLADLGDGADKILAAVELAPREQDDPRDWMDTSFDDADDREDAKETPTNDSEKSEDGPNDDTNDPFDDTVDDEPEPPERGGSQGERPGQRLRLRNMRVIPISDTEAVIAFDLPEPDGGEMRISLNPAGTDRDARLTDQLAVIEAHSLNGIDGPIGVEDGSITFTPATGGRLSMRVTVDGNIQQTALRVN